MGLKEREELYEEYLASLKTLGNTRSELARGVNLAAQDFRKEVAEIDRNLPDGNRIALEAESVAQRTLALGSEVLASLNVEGMLPRRRRPTATDHLAGLDATSAQTAMQNCLAELESTIESIRASRRSEIEGAKRRPEQQRESKATEHDGHKHALELQRQQNQRRLVITLVAALAIAVVVALLTLV